ncbi:MAG: class I SAM-dependent methyltransferase [Herpetosiphonaceae bacterium]|nr:class I SAM-dependent methyltransferase [Herpetosiphonaceae bacterium]
MEQAEYTIMAAVEHQHWWYAGMRAIASAWLDRLPGHHGSALDSLDAGCGTGGNLAHLLGRYGPAFGLDLEPAAVTLGFANAPGRLVRGSVLELPYTDASLDLVTSFEVLYHRAVPDEVAALREVWRVLRPGGWVLLRMPSYAWLRSAHDDAVHTRRRYVAAEVRALLVQAGFTVERCSYINSLLLPLAVAARLPEKLRTSNSGASAASHQTESAMALPHPLVNRLFGSIMNLEAWWLRRGGSFPAGLSILALARKAEVAG